MRFSSNRKPASSSDRRDGLKQARATAPTLRAAYPAAARVQVELAFQEKSGLAHAPQAISVYPPAKAYFVYACPFGDCDGVYDLNEIALGTLLSGKLKAQGKLMCTGMRSRDGKSGCTCELEATYSIVVQHDAPAS